MIQKRIFIKYMKLSEKTIRDLAQMICGRHGTSDKFVWTNFINRSGSDLKDFFIYNCEYELNGSYNGSSREFWVVDVLREINATAIDSSLSLNKNKIFRVIIELLKSVSQSQPDTHIGAIENINQSLQYSGINIKFEDGKYIFIKNEINYDYDFEQFSSNEDVNKDLFIQQFPAGLPFGKSKPHVSILSDKGIQKIQFELINGMAILRKDVYPDFNFRKLEIVFGVDEFTNENLRRSLANMNQTNTEKDFLIQYAKTFDMVNKNIPTLIPQAWIQWHSQTKKDLRQIDSKHSDNLYRVDFAAFWNNKRYAILIDDISHYAKKISSDYKDYNWLADEENYSKRLKEDRKLRKEGWEVFRISNWEIRNKELIPEILNDLKDFIGF